MIFRLLGKPLVNTTCAHSEALSHGWCWARSGGRLGWQGRHLTLGIHWLTLAGFMARMANSASQEQQMLAFHADASTISPKILSGIIYMRIYVVMTKQGQQQYQEACNDRKRQNQLFVFMLFMLGCMGHEVVVDRSRLNVLVSWIRKNYCLQSWYHHARCVFSGIPLGQPTGRRSAATLACNVAG